ncbi:hypothetical protein [Ramlibacter alkalitolerans]|uniref:Recombination-associated protein RdgC n=1 Tax=Ramlibacter alkalitolerans TaxID=2039631 RepID=A0ABS1JUL8_9BURK|nr:hypothetical protein [Ramlibacter alkalitolerans]MBL0427851.1 hypothetical protein [Ramlibacter alkalitolerans]
MHPSTLTRLIRAVPRSLSDNDESRALRAAWGLSVCLSTEARVALHSACLASERLVLDVPTNVLRSFGGAVFDQVNKEERLARVTLTHGEKLTIMGFTCQADADTQLTAYVVGDDVAEFVDAASLDSEVVKQATEARAQRLQEHEQGTTALVNEFAAKREFSVETFHTRKDFSLELHFRLSRELQSGQHKTGDRKLPLQVQAHLVQPTPDSAWHCLFTAQQDRFGATKVVMRDEVEHERTAIGALNRLFRFVEALADPQLQKRTASTRPAALESRL